MFLSTFVLGVSYFSLMSIEAWPSFFVNFQYLKFSLFRVYYVAYAPVGEKAKGDIETNPTFAFFNCYKTVSCTMPNVLLLPCVFRIFKLIRNITFSGVFYVGYFN